MIAKKHQPSHFHPARRRNISPATFTPKSLGQPLLRLKSKQKATGATSESELLGRGDCLPDAIRVRVVGNVEHLGHPACRSAPKGARGTQARVTGDSQLGLLNQNLFEPGTGS